MVNHFLLDQGILGGLDLESIFPSMKNHMLIAVTEMNSKDDIDYLVDMLKEVNNG